MNLARPGLATRVLAAAGAVTEAAREPVGLLGAAPDRGRHSPTRIPVWPTVRLRPLRRRLGAPGPPVTGALAVRSAPLTSAAAVTKIIGVMLSTSGANAARRQLVKACRGRGSAYLGVPAGRGCPGSGWAARGPLMPGPIHEPESLLPHDGFSHGFRQRRGGIVTRTSACQPTAFTGRWRAVATSESVASEAVT